MSQRNRAQPRHCDSASLNDTLTFECHGKYKCGKCLSFKQPAQWQQDQGSMYVCIHTVSTSKPDTDIQEKHVFSTN